MVAVSVDNLLQGFLYQAVTKLDDMDFFNKVVQFDDDPNSVASSEATFIFAGPPVLTGNPQIGPKNTPFKDFLYPIGAVQQYSLQDGKQIIPFKELGSKLSRHAIGYGQYSATLARVLTRYGNLNYAFYSWLYKYVSEVFTGSEGVLSLSILPGEAGQKHWTSTESEIFNIPFGLLCITGSAGGKIVHIEYLERCYIQGGGTAKTAGQSLIVENVSLVVTRPVPFVNQDGTSLLSTQNMKGQLHEFTLQDPAPSNTGTAAASSTAPAA